MIRKEETIGDHGGRLIVVGVHHGQTGFLREGLFAFCEMIGKLFILGMEIRTMNSTFSLII